MKTKEPTYASDEAILAGVISLAQSLGLQASNPGFEHRGIFRQLGFKEIVELVEATEGWYAAIPQQERAHDDPNKVTGLIIAYKPVGFDEKTGQAIPARDGRADFSIVMDYGKTIFEDQLLYDLIKWKTSGVVQAKMIAARNAFDKKMREQKSAQQMAAAPRAEAVHVAAAAPAPETKEEETSNVVEGDFKK